MLKTLLGIVLLAAAAAAGYGAWYVGSPVRIAKYPVEVEIPRGAGFRTAIEQLEKSGIAIRRYEFELLARAHGKVRDIKAGSYEILQPVTPLELLQKLTRGDVTQAEVRLLEGWTFAQFRAALDASPHLRHET
ncbi:MAG TPA: endolytic transglycosylase MltG, partial [Burkholderiales bacterium]|nr:endolytic transglycosylase MltG [Burkholderiales bacterium]